MGSDIQMGIGGSADRTCAATEVSDARIGLFTFARVIDNEHYLAVMRGEPVKRNAFFVRESCATMNLNRLDRRLLSCFQFPLSGTNCAHIWSAVVSSVPQVLQWLCLDSRNYRLGPA